VAEAKKKSSSSYRYIGTYAATLANGRPIEPGEYVDLDADAVKDNEAMIDDKKLIEVNKEG
jgi:hypothetical protein